MRSLGEIRFRLRQELENLRLFVSPPQWGHPLAGPLPGLPDPDVVGAGMRRAPLAESYRKQVEQIAGELLAHRFRLLGLPCTDLGDPIRWRCDFVHGKETGLEYFRRIPYLDFERVGDHKIVWELNRHQHLVLLAQAFLITGRGEFLDEIPRQLDHWIRENPVQRGMNWTSALEIGFRALSWLWVLHLVGRHLEENFRRRWMRSLYHHGLYLEHNLSVYFSPNTHLLGEAVALDALGRLLPQMPRSAQWRELGSETVRAQMRRQVRDDGSHFEQSSYYHLYALDLFLLHSLLDPSTPPWYRDKLARMAEFLDALVSSRGLLPLIGDEDGGRLFHPYGDRRRFAGATLSSCARWFGRPEWVRDPAAALEQAWWWLGPPEEPAPAVSRPERSQTSRWFADTGLAVMRSGSAHVIVDAGRFGSGSAGHSHADTLSIVAFVEGEDLLIDPGTFTYISDAAARQKFRGTAAHNTVSIDSLEQAEPRGPFRWSDPPEVELLHWSSGEPADILDAQCRYRGFVHRRSVVFCKPDVLVVVDQINSSDEDRLAERHCVEQRWMCADAAGVQRIEPWRDSAGIAVSDEETERSTALGSSQAAVRRRVRYEGRLPAVLVTAIHMGRQPESLEPILREVLYEGDSALVQCTSGLVRVEPANGTKGTVVYERR